MIVCNRLCYGGAEHVAVMLANGFQKRGHAVMVVANLFDEISYQLSPSIEITNLYPSIDTVWDKLGGSIHLLRKHIQKFRPDVIVGIMWACSFRALLASTGMKIPVISTVHDSFERPASAPMSAFEKFVKFKLNKLYPVVTVITQSDKDFIGKRLKNVVVMPNPLALTPLNTSVKKDKVVLAAGRLGSWHYKGFDLLIKAWGIIAKRYPDWKVEIAGQGSVTEKTKVQAFIDEAGVGNSVSLLGFCNDMAALYRRSSIFVLSSRYEGFGLVLIEAMSQGCACVATDYKGRQKEIIRNDSEGLLCPPENVKMLADKMDKLMGNEELRRQLQKNAIERSKYYLPKHIISDWECLLKKTAAK